MPPLLEGEDRVPLALQDVVDSFGERLLL